MQAAPGPAPAPEAPPPVLRPLPPLPDMLPDSERTALNASISLLALPMCHKKGVLATFAGAHTSVSADEATSPDAIFIELCRERAPMLLTSSEELIKTYEKEMTSKEIIASIKQGWTGVLQLVLSQVVKQIKVAPGEEFRAAFAAARTIGCFVVLGDRPISITLSRTWACLSLWEKCKLGYSLLLSDLDLKPEDIERLKAADVLTQLIEELSVTLPSIGRVILTERDMFLSAKCARNFRLNSHNGSMQRSVPPEARRVVAIVGMGHVPGIRKYWKEQVNLQQLMQRPPPDSRLRSIVKRVLIITIGLGAMYLIWRGISGVFRLTASYVW